MPLIRSTQVSLGSYFICTGMIAPFILLAIIFKTPPLLIGPDVGKENTLVAAFA